MQFKRYFFRASQPIMYYLLLTFGLLLLTANAQGAVSSQVTMENNGDWGTAFLGQSTIRNTDSSQISGWTLSFEASFEIQNIWGAKVVSHTGNRYLLESAGWNADISPGGEVGFGFMRAPGVASMTGLGSGARDRDPTRVPRALLRNGHLGVHRALPAALGGLYPA